MQPKVLFVSHTTNFIKFNLPYMKWFRDQGWLVHYASAEEEPFPDDVCDAHFRISFQRSPYSTDNIVAYKQIKELIDNQNYQIIHCHTPVGGAVTRLAARDARKRGTKVIYTAHGFHFYRGAPKRNWMLYYPVEKYLSRYTDCLVTMNREDYQLAVNKLHAKTIKKIDGVGVDLTSFIPISTEQKKSLRLQYGFRPDDFILIYTAEFISRKRHAFLVDILPELRRAIPNLKILFCGIGDLLPDIQRKVSTLHLDDIVFFMGYCNNINVMCNMADMLVSVSVQEGLPINIIEGMATGLPIVCANIRGQVDIIQDGINGFLYSKEDLNELYLNILKLYYDPSLRKKIALYNVEDVKKYSLDRALKNMQEIYETVNIKFLEKTGVGEL